MAVIGVDLGGTKLAVAGLTTEGRVLHRAVVALAHRTGPAVGALVVEETLRLRGRLMADGLGTDAVGVCIPGIYAADTGRVWAPNIEGWDDYPLRDELQAALGPDVEVRIDSDRACCVLGEAWLGAAQGCRDVVFLAVGTGIGAGILVDGRILRGHRGIAGAMGWMALDRPFQPGYEACGCFEYHASGAGLARMARERLQACPAYDGALRRDGAVTGADVFAALERGDDLAADVVTEAVALWGMAVANLVSIFDPEKVIFGGGVFGPAVRYLDGIRAEANRWAQPISMRRVALQPSRLGADAGLIGAARLAMTKQGNALPH